MTTSMQHLPGGDLLPEQAPRQVGDACPWPACTQAAKWSRPDTRRRVPETIRVCWGHRTAPLDELPPLREGNAGPVAATLTMHVVEHPEGWALRDAGERMGILPSEVARVARQVGLPVLHGRVYPAPGTAIVGVRDVACEQCGAATTTSDSLCDRCFVKDQAARREEELDSDPDGYRVDLELDPDDDSDEGTFDEAPEPGPDPHNPPPQPPELPMPARNDTVDTAVLGIIAEAGEAGVTMAELVRRVGVADTTVRRALRAHPEVVAVGATTNRRFYAPEHAPGSAKKVTARSPRAKKVTERDPAPSPAPRPPPPPEVQEGRQVAEGPGALGVVDRIRARLAALSDEVVRLERERDRLANALAVIEEVSCGT